MKKNLDTALDELDDMVFFPGKENTPHKDGYKEKTEYEVSEDEKKHTPFYDCWEGY